MDRSPTTPPTTSDQPSSWPDQRSATAGPTTHGSQPSRLGQAFRRLIPERGPVVGIEPAYSTSGGGFRSANRPEPPIRGDAGKSDRGGPQMGGSSGGGGGGPRMPRGGGGAPAPRPERYWTDYLRIVLPIIGLLLMLSVFIFWVGNIIDGNDDGEDTTGTEVAISTTTPDPAAAAPTATVAAAESAAPSTDPAAESPAETASEEPAGEPTAAPEDEATEPPADEEATEAPADEGTEEEPTEEAAAGEAAFAVDDAVVTTTSVNLRSGASAEDDATIIRLLDAGAELTIIGEPENDGEFDWYPVSDADGEGFVREDFLEAA